MKNNIDLVNFSNIEKVEISDYERKELDEAEASGICSPEEVEEIYKILNS